MKTLRELSNRLQELMAKKLTSKLSDTEQLELESISLQIKDKTK